MALREVALLNAADPATPTTDMEGGYAKALTSETGKSMISYFVNSLTGASDSAINDFSPNLDGLLVGIAALNAFLQATVTGPVLQGVDQINAAFKGCLPHSISVSDFRRLCLKALEIDGVSPYQYATNIELLALARHVVLAPTLPKALDLGSSKLSVPWTRLRTYATHYKLLTQPSPGVSATFNKSSQWSDVPSLISLILSCMDEVRGQMLEEEVWDAGDGWSKRDKILCWIEMANYNIMLGRDEKAKEAIHVAKELNSFEYALSGALGKRTRFQENSTSQLVVLAKSAAANETTEATDVAAHPEALPLNDDTLLESIDFQDSRNGNGEIPPSIPDRLKDLPPDNQPQLDPLDQMILLTEATLKDSFSPVDTLTSEEVLPYALRVLADKSTNWQIYTQALIVRSRIEAHRSRTVERGVLQMQAVVDQVVVDVSSSTEQETRHRADTPDDSVPSISITAPGQNQVSLSGDKPRSFFPVPKPSESAPAYERLRYVHALATPPKWHLESELAYAWAGVGSLISALEIFKRLRLWAEVAVCLASTSISDDEEGRGNGGEEKAKGIIRWRLFNRTDSTISVDADDETIEDVTRIKPADFCGPERATQPNAPRLFCILGELEDKPVHYERAWEVSNKRYSRAQKSLGEYYLQQKDWPSAKKAYEEAVSVNRLSSELWSRLGDIHLRLGEFEDAAEAFGRAIAAADNVVGGEDARTWSNLGSALWSLYLETIEELQEAKTGGSPEPDEDEETLDYDAKPSKRDPAKLISQSLTAYKRGAGIARENWRIWDNVLTIASRTRPPSVPDMVLALQNIVRIRPTEDALDEDLLRALLQDAVLAKEKPLTGGVFEPPRGSIERAVIQLFESQIQPLITKRSGLWSLLSQLCIWKRDYAGAISAAEKAWRCATSSSGSGLLPSSGAAVNDWTKDEEGWKEVVRRTDELVSILETFGLQAASVGERWRGKARSAVRSVMSKGKERFEGSEEWRHLDGLMAGLKA